MRWGMVIDLAACTGCGACVVACRKENNVPPTDAETHAQGRTMDWIQLATEGEGEYEHMHVSQRPLMCQHCEEPPCIRVCPVEATYLDGEGIVAQVYARCIGCRYCTNACPYSVKTFNWYAPVWPKGTPRGHNPDVSRRRRGVVEKCTFCHHRLHRARESARAEGRALVPTDFLPACVEICPSGAMVFGDLDDPNSDVARLARDPRAERFHEELGTRPKVVYLAANGGAG